MRGVAAEKNSPAFDEALTAVWRQALVERAHEVVLGGKTYPVRRTAKRRLAQVDFEFEGTEYRGLEQNPQRNSRWAQLARKGAKVMQFLLAGQYIGVVADGKVTIYARGRD